MTTRILRCQLRPGAGKSSLPKNRPLLRSGVSRLHGLNFLPGWNVGAIPGRTSRPACQFTPLVVPDSQQMVWPPLPVPASMLRVSSLISPNPVVCSLPASPGKPKFLPRTQANPVPVNGCREKTDTCGGVSECDGQKVYRVPTVLSCRLLTTTAAASHLQPHREARAGLFGQVLGSREASVVLGDQFHDVQPEPEVGAMVAAGS
jgi:hypothetical protein